MLDWLIIGGGMIGTTLSNYLVNAYDVPAEQVRVLDPHPEPLAHWNCFTGNTGMQYLRSPQVHHIDTEHFSLQNFMNAHPELGGDIRPYRRPAYATFQAHCQQIIQQRGLNQLRLQGSAEFILTTRGGLTVETDQGNIKARRVVLAIGRTALNIPDWAKGNPNIRHIFDSDFSLADVPQFQHAVVIGGGITAGQVALHLAKKQPGCVTLLMRHPIGEADFDSSPCWLGPQCSGMFKRTRSLNKRRWLISEARNRGTMSSDVAKQVRHAVQEGTLQHVEADISSVEAKITLKSGKTLTSDYILLATGFDMARPGGAWLDELIDWFDLPVADCGYPIVDKRLCWGKNIYVSGGLAELELGPPAGNIVGGRLAAERLNALINL